MIRNGTKPTVTSHKDYDFVKSFGAVSAPNFPTEYSTDANLTMPNQNAENDQFIPPVPAMFFGCTDYAQSELATDLDGVLKNPYDLEKVTGANAKGGYDIRTSLLYARNLGWITGFFNVQPHQLDMFDTIRLAMISGIPEKRSVTIGVPWYAEFETTVTKNADGTTTQSALPVNWGGILSMPTSGVDRSNTSWHNAKCSGWKMIKDQPYLIIKSWQGKQYGDNGWCYMSRALCNTIFAVPGTVAFTSTKGVLPPISTISVTLWQWFISNWRSLLGLQY